MAYQEDNGDVQSECDETVQEEREQTDMVDLVHRDLGKFPEQSNDKVHDCADWCKVVQRDQGVHLVLCRAQQPLYHGKTDGLEYDTRDLEQKADHDELDFANGCDHHSNNNRGDVQEHSEVRLRYSHAPAAEQDGDGCGGLEHLDEGDAQVQVSQVAADQAQAEKQTDRDDGPQVHPARHLHGLAPIEESSVAGQQLCHDGRESQVVAGQYDRVVYEAPVLANASCASS